jgi:type I restriction enzyme S subunit
MEVKAGYKLTEVGVIPSDWEVRPLPEVSWFQEGPGLRDWQFTSTGIKVINVTNLENGLLNLKRTDRHISLSEFRQMYQRFAIDAADIVMASSGNSYSKTAVVRQQDLPLVMNTSVIRFKPLKICDHGFLLTLLNSSLFKTQIDLIITGGAQPNFGPYHLKRLNVPLPPLPEQRAIATALSDVDALLSGLDRLIAKKRNLKQAVIQQLLTGQTRLPGFHGDWEVKRLGDVLTICHGKSQRDVAVADGPYPILATGGQIGTASHPLYNKPSVLIGRKGTIDQPQYMETPFWTVDTLFYSAMKNGNDAKFLYYRFCVIRWTQFNEASGVPSLNARTIEQIEIPCPEPTEQAAIAAVLSDMDAELSALKARRDKTSAIKQAMMQELLTGRTRLVTKDNNEGKP